MTLIILDRDGVINEDSDHYIRSVDEWIPIPGSIEAIARLHQNGHQIAIATNQSGIARGFYDTAELNAMHDKLKQLVAAAGGRVDYITYCPHVSEDNCQCRKPKPGMLLEILRYFRVNAAEVVFVGDNYPDYQAALAAGVQFILVRTGKGERILARQPELAKQVEIYPRLADFVQQYLP